MFLNDKDRQAIERLRDAELRAGNGVDFALDWNDVRRVRLLAEQADEDAALDEQRKLREQLDAAADAQAYLRKRLTWQDKAIASLRAENRDLEARLDAVKKALRPPKKNAHTPRRARRPKASPA